MAERILNVNIGVLGHVDSGKTSLGEPPRALVVVWLDTNGQLCPVTSTSTSGASKSRWMGGWVDVNICQALLGAGVLKGGVPGLITTIRMPRCRHVVAKTLSTVASTASFDKSSESKERGITLDLGTNPLNTPHTHLPTHPRHTLH